MPQNTSRSITLALWLAERHKKEEANFLQLMHETMRVVLPQTTKLHLVTRFDSVGQRTGAFGPRRWTDVIDYCADSRLASFGTSGRMPDDVLNDWPPPFDWSFTTVRKHEPFRKEKQEFWGRDVVFGICPERWVRQMAGDEIVASMLPILQFAVDKLQLFQAHIRVTGVPEFDQHCQKFLQQGARERFTLASEDYVCPAWLTVIHPLLFGRYFESSRLTNRFHTEEIGRNNHVLVRLTDHIDDLKAHHLEAFAIATRLREEVKNI